MMKERVTLWRTLVCLQWCQNQLSWDLVKIDTVSNKVHQLNRGFFLFFFFNFCDVAEVAIIHKTI